METRIIATMVMRILILVSSCYLISCGGHMRTYDDNFSLYGDSSINQFVLRDTSSFASINNMPKIIDDFNIGEFIGFSNASSTEFVLLVRERKVVIFMNQKLLTKSLQVQMPVKIF